MAKTQSIGPFEPENLASDAGWVVALSAQDRLAYWTARKTFDQASGAFNAAVFAANQALAKVQTDYDAIADKYSAAVESFNVAGAGVSDAQSSLSSLVNEPGLVDYFELGLPIPQLLQEFTGNYTAASQAVGPAASAWGVAYTALASASQPPAPGQPFVPESASINVETTSIADAQNELAIAAATAPYEQAWDMLLQKRAVLYSHLEDQAPGPAKPIGPVARRTAAAAAAN